MNPILNHPATLLGLAIAILWAMSRVHGWIFDGWEQT
jgi:hypothetical protein